MAGDAPLLERLAKLPAVPAAEALSFLERLAKPQTDPVIGPLFGVDEEGDVGVNPLVPAVLKQLADKQDLTKKKDDPLKDDDAVDNRPKVQCVVIGYMVSNKQLSGLVLGMLDNERLSYAGTVEKGFSEEQSKEILQKLATAVRATPLIKGLNMAATWVKPAVFCEVHHSGTDKDGKLIKPRFAGLLTKDY